MLDIAKVFSSTAHGRVLTTYDRNSTLVPSSFAFVLNVGRLPNKRTMRIGPGLSIRRAKKVEIKFTTETLKSVFGSQFHNSLWETRPPAGGKGSYVQLPVNEWRYHVVEIRDDVNDIDDLELALLIARTEINLGFIASRLKINTRIFPAYTYRPPQMFQSLSELARLRADAFANLSKSDIANVTETYKRLRAFDHTIRDLKPVFAQLLEIKDLPGSSPLQILGYFAILESILTHQPMPDDRYDSITRQITRKLALLNGRWSDPIDYSAFGSALPAAIWPKMYAYRSAIAHGAKPDFKGPLQQLKSKENADELLKSTVRNVIRHCLIEPQLIVDLHNC